MEVKKAKNRQAREPLSPETQMRLMSSTGADSKRLTHNGMFLNTCMCLYVRIYFCVFSIHFSESFCFSFPSLFFDLFGSYSHSFLIASKINAVIIFIFYVFLINSFL